ncbi:MAG: hypothetical protein SNH27_12700 [Rikenellaceae bacterium]
MKINYKVSHSQRPIWLLKCIAEFRECATDSDSKDILIDKLNECLNRQHYELGGGSGQYSCRFIQRFVSEGNDSIDIFSITGKRLLCTITLS